VFYLCRSIYKALCLGFSPVLGGDSIHFVSKNFNSDGSSPVKVRDVLGGIRASFCDFRLRPESCISYSYLGVLRANMKCDVLWS